MIKLEITLDKIDYDSLIDRCLPLVREKLQTSSNPVALLLSNGMSASMAKQIVRALPQDKKDELAAELINGNRTKLMQQVEKLAEGHQISVDVIDVGVVAEP